MERAYHLAVLFGLSVSSSWVVVLCSSVESSKLVALSAGNDTCTVGLQHTRCVIAYFPITACCPLELRRCIGDVGRVS